MDTHELHRQLDAIRTALKDRHDELQEPTPEDFASEGEAYEAGLRRLSGTLRAEFDAIWDSIDLLAGREPEGRRPPAP